MTDIQRALLGDHEAQDAITARGELLPCWRCGGQAEVETLHTGGKPIYAVVCKKHYCGAYGSAHHTKQKAIEEWNTRAPLLTPTQLALLEISREPRKMEVDISVDDV